jgi:hypothetical protein
MSIDKIKERIKMIEENNFNIINEASINPGSYTKQDFDAISKSDNAKNLFYKLGAAGTNVNDAEKYIKSAFSGGSNRVTVGDLIQLPNDYAQDIFPIYKLLKKYNVLTDDLDDTRFTAIVGYKPERGRNFKINNKLVLQSSREIDFLFQKELDNKSTPTNNKLLQMSIDLSSFTSNNATSINNFINELTTNKTSYNISNINKIGSEVYLIKFN